MKTHLLKLKAELKVLAAKNRHYKNLARSQASFMDKNYPRRYSWENYKRLEKDEEYQKITREFSDAWKNSGDPYVEFRSKHIAYCMLRGRKLEEIEPKLRDPSSYTHTVVRKKAAAIVAEVLRESAAQP